MAEAQRKFRLILVKAEPVHSEYVKVLTYECEPDVRPGANLPGVVHYQDKFYTFQYIINGEYAAQYIEATLFDIAD